MDNLLVGNITVVIPELVATEMVKMTDTHIHSYKKLYIYRIKRVHPSYNGTSGDKAFLLYLCKCKKALPFDYGTTRDMTERYKSLVAK